jgi:hypothetical protein
MTSYLHLEGRDIDSQEQSGGTFGLYHVCNFDPPITLFESALQLSQFDPVPGRWDRFFVPHRSQIHLKIAIISIDTGNLISFSKVDRFWTAASNTRLAERADGLSCPTEIPVSNCMQISSRSYFERMWINPGYLSYHMFRLLDEGMF